MRVDAYNAISQIYQPKKTYGAKSANKVAGAKDEFSISSFGKDLQVAKQAVAEASDVREDKVAEMKAKYAGNASVDTGDFADVLLAKYQGMF